MLTSKQEQVFMSEGAFDLLLIYQFIKRIATPFEKQAAYKLGIIDKTGKKIKDPETKDEKKAFGYTDRLIFNIKKLVAQLPGGKSKIANFAAALFLIREGKRETPIEYTMTELQEKLENTMLELNEDAPVNSTGTAVPGSGDNTNDVHFKKKGEDSKVLKRFKKENTKTIPVKSRKEIMSKYGISK